MMRKQLTGNTYKLFSLFADILSNAMYARDEMTSADDDTSYRVARARYTMCLDFLAVGESAFERFCAAYEDAVRTFRETDQSDAFDRFMNEPLATDFFISFFGVEVDA